MLCLRLEFNSNTIHTELTGALDSLPLELYITTFNYFVQNLEETLAIQL